MLEGRKVWIQDPHNLRIFFPSHRIVKSLPLLYGNYIYIGEIPLEFNRFPKSIWVSKEKSEFVLDNANSIVGLLMHFKRISATNKEYLLSIKDINELWKRVRDYYFFNIIPVVGEESKVFKLFSKLGDSNRVILEEYRKLDLPRLVLLSSLLTMIIKAQSYKEYQGQISDGYMKTLYLMNKTLKNVKVKFVDYWMSSQTELDLLNLLFSLKR